MSVPFSSFDISLSNKSKLRLPLSKAVPKEDLGVVDVKDVRTQPKQAPRSDSIEPDPLPVADKTMYILAIAMCVGVMAMLLPRGSLLAVNYGVLCCMPLLSSAVTLQGHSRSGMVMFGVMGCCFLALASVWILLAVPATPMLFHLPGILCLSIFFYSMTMAWRRILILVCAVLAHACVVLNVVIESNFDNREAAVSMVVAVFVLLFTEACVSVDTGEVLCAGLETIKVVR